jgi:hypothetical protein
MLISAVETAGEEGSEVNYVRPGPVHLYEIFLRLLPARIAKSPANPCLDCTLNVRVKEDAAVSRRAGSCRNRHCTRSWGSTVSVEARLMAWTSGVEFPTGKMLGFLFFATPALGPIQTLIRWIPAALTVGIKRSGREAATHLYLVPSLRIHGIIPPCLHMSSWRGA